MKDENDHINKNDKLRLSPINEDAFRFTPTVGKQYRNRDTKEYQEKVEKVFELIKEGLRSNEILTILSIEDEGMTEDKFIKILHHAYEYAEIELHKDREYTFQLHMNRYESMYNKSIQMTDFWGRPLDKKKDWAVMRMKFKTAMEALKNKENLLGLHDKSIVLEFNDHKAIVAEQESSTRRYIERIDLDKLTIEEKIELLSLVREARTVPIEGVQRVIVKKTIVEINTDTLERQEKRVIKTIHDVETHDIDFEEMPPNVVKEFKEDIKPVEEIEEESGPKFIDNTIKGVEPKKADDIKESINKSMLEQFKKKIKEQKGK